MSPAFSVEFVVIVWLTEMVISIHQRILFQERGLGRGNWGREFGMVESKEEATVLLLPLQVEYPETLSTGWVW